MCPRDSCGLILDWKTKRSVHIQLEILLNALQAVVGKLLPVISLAFSVLACTSTVMLLHINPLSEGQGCAYCALLVLGAVASGSGVLAATSYASGLSN